MSELDAFLRQSIGFNKLINSSSISGALSNFPPFNIEQIGEHQYRLTLAVAGMKKDEINIDIVDGILTIATDRNNCELPEDVTYIYRGIAQRDFTKSWKLGEYVEVTEAKMEDGLLVVSLERNIPEALKPKQILIK